MDILKYDCYELSRNDFAKKWAKKLVNKFKNLKEKEIVEIMTANKNAVSSVKTVHYSSSHGIDAVPFGYINN
jgi:hypothetical protein